MTITHLQTLGVHLIPFLWPGPVQTRVSLLIDEEVREVYLFEFKLDGPDELFRNEISSLGP